MKNRIWLSTACLLLLLAATFGASAMDKVSTSGEVTVKTVVFSGAGVSCSDGVITLHDVFRVKLDVKDDAGPTVNLTCTWQKRCECAFLTINNAYTFEWDQVGALKIVKGIT